VPRAQRFYANLSLLLMFARYRAAARRHKPRDMFRRAVCHAMPCRDVAHMSPRSAHTMRRGDVERLPTLWRVMRAASR